MGAKSPISDKSEKILKKRLPQMSGDCFRRGAKTEKLSVFPGSVAVHRQTLQKMKIA
jgi:hypothetical protein